MPAKTPEQVNELLIDALTRGDVEAATALYEPEASFVNEGTVINGQAAIRSILEAFIATRPKFEVRPKMTVRSGDIALTGNHWSLEGIGPDGKAIAMSGSSFEVVRRGVDGNWRFVIDNPDVS